MYILIETADRETGVLKFNTMKEAQDAMYEAFKETLDDNEYMETIYKAIKTKGYYEDEICGINENGGWFNRYNGGHLDWVIEEIKTREEEKNAIEYYWDMLHSVMKMKMMDARETAKKEDDYDCYNAGWLDGQYAGLKEAVRTLEASRFLI